MNQLASPVTEWVPTPGASN